MAIGPISPGPARVEDVNEASKTRKVEGESRATDKISISEEALRAQRLERDKRVALEVINSLPETREDKVNLAKERLKSGFYESTNVREVLVEKLGEIL